MTFKQFLAECRKIKGWRLKKEGQIRYRAGKKHDLECCPITAVAFRKSKRYFELSKYPVAAIELNLVYEISNITFAADDLSLNLEQKSIRRKLLKACGLKERKVKKAA